jgi:hypothetical protein
MSPSIAPLNSCPILVSGPTGDRPHVDAGGDELRDHEVAKVV